MIIADYHTHTTYSHGKCSAAEAAALAYQNGIKTLAISEHGKGNVFYGLKDSDFLKLRKETDALNELYAGEMRILLGIEADFLGGGMTDIPKGIDFDVILVGYHRGIVPKNGFAVSALVESFTSRERIEKNTDEVLRTFDRYPDIMAMTHPNEYIRINIDRLSKEAAARGILLEINNRHVTLTEEDLKICASNNAHFIISSDGHLKDEICRFDNAIKVAERAGVLDRVVNWTEQ